MSGQEVKGYGQKALERLMAKHREEQEKEELIGNFMTAVSDSMEKISAALADMQERMNAMNERIEKLEGREVLRTPMS